MSISTAAERRRRISVSGASAALLIGITVLTGWAFDLDALKTLPTGFVSMKANTALCFMLLGLACLLAQNPTPSLWRRRLGHGCAGGAALMGLLVLTEYGLGLSLGIDELLFRDPRSVIGSSHPGRMAPNSAFNFLLLGIAAVLLGRSPKAVLVAHLLVLLALTTTGIAFTGYLFNAQVFITAASLTLMALHTMIGFFALGVAMLFSRGDEGLMKVILAASPGGYIARRLLAATIIFPSSSATSH